MLNAIRNYIHTQRAKRYMRKLATSPQWLKRFSELDAEGLVRLIEPGAKSNFLQSNTASYFDLEHRYGVHIWIYAAVNVIAEKSAVPKLVAKDADGEIQDMELLPPKPNMIHTWDDVNQLLSVWLELTGNAYLYHDTDTDMFYPLRPSRVRIVPDEDGNSILGYGYRRTYTGDSRALVRQRRASAGKAKWMHDDPETLKWDRKTFEKHFDAYRNYIEKGHVELQDIPDREKDDWVPFEASEVLHFRYPSPTSDYYGHPPIYPLLSNLQTELYARQWNLKFFENGAIPPGVLIIPKVLPAEKFKEIMDKLNKQYTGTGNRGKPLVLQGGEIGADYKAFPGQHRDLEFLSGLDHSRDEILAVLNVPHVMVNASMTGSHSSNLSPGIREYERIFWQDTMMPKQKMKASRWTQHFIEKLPDGWTLGYDYSEIPALRPDYAELAKAAALALKAGRTVREVRREIWGVSEEWEGDLYLPGNVMALEGTQMPETPQALPMPEEDDELLEPMPPALKEAAD